mgnify:CR=1 FL=1
MALIETEEAAKRLARVILSDIELYNRKKIQAGADLSAELREGYTLFRPGYLRHLLEYDANWLGANVALAGDYLVAPTVEGAVISGRRAANHLLRE